MPSITLAAGCVAEVAVTLAARARSAGSGLRRPGRKASSRRRACWRTEMLGGVARRRNVGGAPCYAFVRGHESFGGMACGGRGGCGVVRVMQLYLLIALGGALGSVGRFACAEWVARQWGTGFPWGILLVNVLGSLVIGFFATYTGPEGRAAMGAEGRVFFMTGVLGGFTTFSTFSLQTLMLAREGEWLRAGGNAAGSLVLCLVAVWLGHLCAVALGGSR